MKVLEITEAWNQHGQEFPQCVEVGESAQRRSSNRGENNGNLNLILLRKVLKPPAPCDRRQLVPSYFHHHSPKHTLPLGRGQQTSKLHSCGRYTTPQEERTPTNIHVESSSLVIIHRAQWKSYADDDTGTAKSRPNQPGRPRLADRSRFNR